MKNCRSHGEPPFRIAVIHGGPGAAGEMAPVARELARDQGVLEPLQTADSVAGQVGELRRCLDQHAHTPAILIGYSWGAWLALLTAAEFPGLVAKLILVGCPGFTPQAGRETEIRRAQRMNETLRAEVYALGGQLRNSRLKPEAHQRVFERLGRIYETLDAFDPLPGAPDEPVACRPDLFAKVWPEADRMRTDGRLLRVLERIACPIAGIHGDHDPHPGEQVREALAGLVRNVTWHWLKDCGHTPWKERGAIGRFYQTLRQEVGPPG